MSKADTVLREFLSATKPDWTIPTDVLLMAQLIALVGEYPGHEAMSARCSLKDAKAVMRSLKRLEAAGWITKTDGEYTVQAGTLPSQGKGRK
jgi:DNA-binding MarR family transcriptional regulator